MVRTKRSARWPWLIMMALMILTSPLLLSLGLGEGRPVVQAASCWNAAITQQWTDLDLAGSVLRVSVHGKVGLPVTVRSMGSFQTVGFTSTKPEYGPFVAEFAPLTKGTYFIEPQGLGIVFEVFLDGKNYTRVDFTPLPCAPTSTPTPLPRPTRATATRQVSATATKLPLSPTQAPLPVGWHGRVVQHLKNLSGREWGTIVVNVKGRPAGQEVEIQSGNWSESCKTGTKPEYGGDACEFGALRTGTYRLTPKDLGTHLDVTLERRDFVRVEFYQTGKGETTTQWVGSVVENTSGSEPTQHVHSAIAVIVDGKPWHEVEIRAGGYSATCTTGTKPDYGPAACEFGGLRAATYTITPKDLGVSVIVTMDGWGWAKTRFQQVTVPGAKPTIPPQPTVSLTPSSPPTKTAKPGPTSTSQPSPTPVQRGWKAWIISNTSEPGVGAGVSSIIVVRVLNYGGVPVHINGGGNWSDTCISGSKPEFGPDACSFGGLWAGTYYIQPEGADIEQEIEMDGLGKAEVHFAPP